MVDTRSVLFTDLVASTELQAPRRRRRRHHAGSRGHPAAWMAL